jgi:hypothetical protein
LVKPDNDTAKASYVIDYVIAHIWISWAYRGYRVRSAKRDTEKTTESRRLLYKYLNSIISMLLRVAIFLIAAF